MIRKTFTHDAKIYLAGLFVIVLCLGVSLISGCTKEAESQVGSAAQSEVEESSRVVSFTDDLGNEVTVDNPQRVVACMGSFANTWELAGGALVGATEDAFTSYAIASIDAARVGDFTAPNLEEIIALEPDFVIMTGASTGKDGTASQTDLKQTLEASGIKVAYFNVTTFDDYLRMLRTFCDITGSDELYEQNGVVVEQQIESLKTTAMAHGKQPRVLLMTTFSGGTRVQTSTTMTGTMLSDLGAVNLADENKSLLKDFSLESVIELDPDFIFVVPMGNDNAAAMKNLTEATEANPAWSTLSAVKNDHFITLSMDQFLAKPNDRWAESYQILSDYLSA